VRELKRDLSSESFHVEHKKTSLDERFITMRLQLSRLSCAADGVPPDCNQSDQASICKDELQDLKEFIAKTMA